MGTNAPTTNPVADAEADVIELEERLEKARGRLTALQLDSDGDASPSPATSQIIPQPSSSSTHFLLLLSDSALPLGSFAFSSGLESYLAHARAAAAAAAASTSSAIGSNSKRPAPPTFASLLPDSLSSYASTTLPFVLAAHRDPAALAELDDALDAAIICSVGRRASTAQGRALLGIWERSFAGAVSSETVELLRPFSVLLKASSAALSASSSSTPSSAAIVDGATTLPTVSAHLGPLFGAVARLVGLSARQTAYVFMLSHIKALVSAAVRASMFGPYQAQRILAGNDVQAMIAAVVDREWETPFEEAAQTVPVMDLWIGRHELLYSRIFNS